MERKYNPTLVANAARLRKDMTKEERHLWYDFLRGHAIRFERQKILGRYIADFYCPKAKIVIELDGSQHFEEVGQEYDSKRTAFLEQYGIQMIRIPNNEINHNFEGVCEYINYILRQRMDAQASRF